LGNVMDSNSFLIFVLIGLVVLLTIILLRRIRHEKYQTAVIQQMSLTDFSEFLLTNSIDGTIGDVARKVSDLLQKSIGCDRIVFLRKKRRFLELNYYHGIRRFNRLDFRIEYQENLARTLTMDYLPRPLEKLQGVLPVKYYDMLRQQGLMMFFPIFWRNNLYGVYFVRSSLKTNTTAFNLLVASLAQSLSAAYHVKWHESRNEYLLKQLQETNTTLSSGYNGGKNISETHLLKLVKHHSSETIVPDVIKSIKKDLGINRIAYLWQKNSEKEKPPHVVQEGVDNNLDVSRSVRFDQFEKLVNDGKTVTIENLIQTQPSIRPLMKTLRNSGLTHLVSFPLANDRPGILAWSSNKDPVRLRQQLDRLHNHVVDLVENAESFERIEAMSYTDNLTGLANQRYFNRRLEEEIQRAKRYNRELALIIFDLDQLKQINDTYGHLAGDMALRQVGKVLRKSIRTIDIIARYGGDEFCIIMPEAETSTCTKFMERLRKEIGRVRLTIDRVPTPLSFTISLGGAIFPIHAKDSKQLVYAADMALIKAKDNGRNTSWLFSENLQTTE